MFAFGLLIFVHLIDTPGTFNFKKNKGKQRQIKGKGAFNF
jgi:hypothetical protein